MFAFTDLRRSLTAKVLLGLLLLGFLCVAVYGTGRFLNIRSQVMERESKRAEILAEPMHFALENLAESHPEITTQTERLQRLVGYLAKTGGIQAVAVMDAAGRRVLAAAGDPSLLRGRDGDLPQRAQSLDRTLTEPTPDGQALLVAVPLRRPPKGKEPSDAFGALVLQYDLTRPVHDRERQTLNDIGVLGLGMLVMSLMALVGLRYFILDPLSRLARQTAALGAGDLSARSGITAVPGGGDEMARLAAGFDRMASELQAAAAAQSALHEVLRASEARGRAVFEHASIAISQGDARGYIMDANPAFLQLWGYTLEELQGVRWIDLTHPDDRDESLRESQRLLAGEIDGFALEKRYVRKDGQLVWVSVNVDCLRDASGQVLMLVLVAEDISPRKRAEQVRAEHEELYQAMFEKNRTVQLLVDPENAAVIDANTAAAEFYGYSREELCGPLSQISDLPIELIRRNMAEARERGGVFPVPHRLKSGEIRDVIARSGPFRAGGRTLLLSSIQDVTEGLRTEAALKETEERLRLLIDLMDEGVVLTTSEGLLKYVNPSFARMFGQEPATLEGRSYQDLLAPECAAIHPQRLEARRQGSREPYEARYLRPDGSEALAQVSPFPLFTRGSAYQGSCAIIKDITQARAREEAERLRGIRRSALLRLHEMHAASRQELLDFALEQLLLLTDSPLGYIYAYDEARRQFVLHAWSQGVMELCSVQDKMTVYELDATGIWGDAVRLRQPLLLNDFAAPDPRKKGCPEGHVELSRFLTLPVIRAGRVVAVVGLGNKAAPYLDEDVTQVRLFTDGLWNVLERQEAVAELSTVSARYRDLASLLRLMCDNVPDMLWAKDLNKRFLFANKAMCEGLLNAKDTSEPVGKNDLFFALRERAAHPDDPAWHTFGEVCQDSDSITMEQGAPGQFDEFGNVQGRFLYLDVRKAPFVNTQGEVIGTVGSARDITERKRAEEALRRAKAVAEAATLTKAQFLANMSHEIRTPLGGVIGAAQLLAQSRLSSSQRQLAEMAVESGRALLGIVNDILDFSKIEAGRLDLRPAPFALRADLDAVAAPFRLLAEGRGLTLDVEIDPAIPDALVCDHGRLDQVLRNLLGNAVKFTETGAITLEVTLIPARPTPQTSVCVRFTVRDTGQGISPDFLPHIFESFSQADDSYAKRHGGTGLGLAISRSLVERMAGSLEATSSLGQGSAFYFTLCLCLAGADTAAEASSPSPAGDKARQTLPLRVLLAEDNEIGRILLERMMKDAGHITVSVANGREALDALSREAFDLVLMDVQMPEVDGVSATRSIRKGEAGVKNTNIPIVALTAYAQQEDRERFLAAGMDGYVPKPVEETELMAAIQRAMSLRAERKPDKGQANMPLEAPMVAPASDPSAAPRFDSDYLTRSFGERTDLLDDLLAQFLETSLPEIEHNLRQTFSVGDMATAQRVAHKAKGTFGTVGARRAALLAQAAERAARTGDSELFRQRSMALLDEMAALHTHLSQGRIWPGKEKA